MVITGPLVVVVVVVVVVVNAAAVCRSLKEGTYYVCAGLANGTLVFYDDNLLLVR